MKVQVVGLRTHGIKKKRQWPLNKIVTATLKYDRPKLKFNVDIALMVAIHGFKSILLTFNEPAIPAPKSKDHTDSQSLLPSLGTIVSLVFFNGSCNPSKQPKLASGGNHNMGSDMLFLLKTLRRLLNLHIFGVVALICLRSANDDSRFSHHTIFDLVKYYRLEIKTFCWGIFSWTNLDLYGCLLRLLMFAIKTINRLLPRIVLHQSISTKLNRLNQVDLNGSFPFAFKRNPIKASSLTDFWSRHWHSVYKSAFVEAGSAPTIHFLVKTCGLKPDSKIVRLSGIMGAFAISAVVHEIDRIHMKGD
ncbi:uncharacterized protein PGTG_16397 [Puccinia graminis f. sp. tritici CRL 75-36-700-3]|uniref:Wax synthase domain-containing protein n=1 Tax=Puccinia graminis f. sp. tritici (strain CRL 75-36-700-3 / race SCCL) TaxID=418459 RepID=E3L3T1_PUCGT|nr:uncharacterized protein PGTG_16397 [Puccinia graminis f. sp. tritici CRL 75-36-700-3]EFP91206.1 hypothetical protein PGTG_16397 [Puccinia graminis f. sp. tritici CRL 75-36-700-3]